MAAIIFGLVAALLWGVSAIVGTRLVRLVGAWGSVTMTMLTGLAFVLPAALAVDPPHASLTSWGWAVATGFCYVAATACWLLAVRSGKVSVVVPIVSTDGAMAALIAVTVLGEEMPLEIAVTLAVIVAGIVVAGLRRDLGEEARFTGRELVLALGAAGLFGLSFVGSAQAEEAVGVVWTLLASRIAAVAVLVPVVVAVGGFRLSRIGLPLAAAMAALDVGGYAAFLVGVSAGVAVTSVLASQYAIVAVVGGFLALGERLTRLQTVGVGLTLAGVAALAALRG